MPDRVEQHDDLQPRRRVRPEVDSDGHFFPGEAARLIGVPGLDYRQLRDIFQLVREQAGTAFADPKSWSRYSYVDLAGAIEVVRLCIDTDALDAGRKPRLRLARLRRACLQLRKQGLSNPLLQAKLDLVDGQIVAQIQGLTFNPRNGQLLLETVGVSVQRKFRNEVDHELRSILQQISASYENTVAYDEIGVAGPSNKAETISDRSP